MLILNLYRKVYLGSGWERVWVFLKFRKKFEILGHPLIFIRQNFSYLPKVRNFPKISMVIRKGSEVRNSLLVYNTGPRRIATVEKRARFDYGPATDMLI